jgi:hypothetical protein
MKINKNNIAVDPLFKNTRIQYIYLSIEDLEVVLVF